MFAREPICRNGFKSGVDCIFALAELVLLRNCAACPAAQKMFARMNKCGTICENLHLFAAGCEDSDGKRALRNSFLTSGRNLYILLKMSKFGREAGARMSPRVQANESQKRLRTPRIPFLFFQTDLIFKALTKEIFLFDQSFFIAPLSKPIDLLRIVVFEKKAFKEFFPQYYICFPTSV